MNMRKMRRVMVMMVVVVMVMMMALMIIRGRIIVDIEQKSSIEFAYGMFCCRAIHN